jgi:hypothetical protein
VASAHLNGHTVVKGLVTFSHLAPLILALNFRDIPLGIDVREMAETGILPRLNTSIAHKKPGIGMVGVAAREW